MDTMEGVVGRVTDGAYDFGCGCGCADCGSSACDNSDDKESF